MIVYGASVSYYTGKLEAYLRYKGISYERASPYPQAERIKREAGCIQHPVVERDDGRWMGFGRYGWSDGAAPIYKYLTSKDTKPAGKGNISWNFEKFLVDREGQLIARFSPRTKPSDGELIKAIEGQLAD